MSADTTKAASIKGVNGGEAGMWEREGRANETKNRTKKKKGYVFGKGEHGRRGDFILNF